MTFTLTFRYNNMKTRQMYSNVLQELLSSNSRPNREQLNLANRHWHSNTFQHLN